VRQVQAGSLFQSRARGHYVISLVPTGKMDFEFFSHCGFHDNSFIKPATLPAKNLVPCLEGVRGKVRIGRARIPLTPFAEHTRRVHLPLLFVERSNGTLRLMRAFLRLVRFRLMRIRGL